MNIQRLTLIGLVCLFLAGGTSAYCSVTYTVRGLGKIDGTNCSYASDINDTGQIVGASRYRAGNIGYPVLWNPGSSSPTRITELSGYNDAARKITENGLVAISSNSGAYLWSESGGDQYLGSGRVNSVNEAGWAAGHRLSGSYPKGIIWKPDGSTTNFGVLPGDNSSIVNDINDNGSVVGFSFNWNTSLTQPNYEHPVMVAASGQVTMLQTLSGGAAEPLAVNNFSRSVGTAWASDGSLHACVWEADGTITDLGSPGGTGRAWASDINDAGLIIGTYAEGVPVPVYWDAGGNMINLPLLPGHIWGGAHGVNNLGQIVGYSKRSIDSDDEWEAVIWEPVPEPSGLLAILGGLGSMGMFAGRRRKPKA